MNKICLFYTSNLSNKIIYYNFIKKNPKFFSEVIEFPIIPENKSKLLKKILASGLKFITFQFLVNFYYKQLNFFFGKKISSLCYDHKIKYSYFPNQNQKLIEKIKKEKYDFIFNGQTSILKKKILSIKKTRFINCHCAPLPDFKGPANYIWLLLKKNKCYSTLHFVDHTIDGGKIIDFSKKISFSKFDSVFNLWLKMRILGTKCIQKNKEKFLKNKNFHRKKSKKKAVIRSFPKSEDIKNLQVPFFKFSDLVFILLEPFKK